MKAIITLEIHPSEPARVTPLELLEDFADAAPAWLFLETDSQHYAAVKGVPACVLRHVTPTGQTDFDLAFAADGPGASTTIRLLVVDTPAPEEHPPPPAAQQEALHRFADAFESYLHAHNDPASLRIVERELDRTAADSR